MDSLFTLLENITILSDECKNAIKSTLRIKTISKGMILVESQNVCNNFYFIQKGSLRGFYFLKNKDVTNWIHIEGMFATSSSFVSRTISYESIEALEDSTVLVINFNALEKLQHQFREILIIRLHITQIFHGMLEDRLLMLRFLSAKERYDNLIKKEPYLFNRAALGHIASYLGMTQVNLSRIRKLTGKVDASKA